MTREEYLALPPALALSILLDQLPKFVEKLAAIPKPKNLALSPRYDRKVTKKSGQYSWCSECLLEDLMFFHKRSTQPTDNPKYAESNRKEAEELSRWIAWRTLYPTAVWGGTRDSNTVVAAPPRRDAELHDWKRGPRNDPPAGESTGASGYSDSDYGGDDSGIPF